MHQPIRVVPRLEVIEKRAPRSCDQLQPYRECSPVYTHLYVSVPEEEYIASRIVRCGASCYDRLDRSIVGWLVGWLVHSWRSTSSRRCSLALSDAAKRAVSPHSAHACSSSSISFSSAAYDALSILLPPLPDSRTLDRFPRRRCLRSRSASLDTSSVGALSLVSARARCCAGGAGDCRGEVAGLIRGAGDGVAKRPAVGNLAAAITRETTSVACSRGSHALSRRRWQCPNEWRDRRNDGNVQTSGEIEGAMAMSKRVER